MSRRGTRAPADSPAFLLRLQLVRERIANPGVYPFSIPAIAAVDGLELHPRVTYFVGENGSPLFRPLTCSVSNSCGVSPSPESQAHVPFTIRPRRVGRQSR
jgi:hypothetical protein